MCGSPHHKNRKRMKIEADEYMDHMIEAEKAGKLFEEAEPSEPNPSALLGTQFFNSSDGLQTLFQKSEAQASSTAGHDSADMEVDIPPRYDIADHLLMEAATMMPRNLYGYARNRSFRFPRDIGIALGRLFKVLFKMIANGIQWFDFLSGEQRKNMARQGQKCSSIK